MDDLHAPDLNKFISDVRQVPDLRAVQSSKTTVPLILANCLHPGSEFSFFIKDTNKHRDITHLSADGLGAWNGKNNKSSSHVYFLSRDWKPVKKVDAEYILKKHNSTNCCAEPAKSVTRRIWRAFHINGHSIGMAIVSYSFANEFKRLRSPRQRNTPKLGADYERLCSSTIMASWNEMQAEAPAVVHAITDNNQSTSTSLSCAQTYGVLRTNKRIDKYSPYHRRSALEDHCSYTIDFPHVIRSMRDCFGRSEHEYSRLVARANNRMLNQLWEQKRIPEEPWTEHTLELLLAWLASHDTNNRSDLTPLGAGEREGRVVCPLVRRLHCSLSHGIGRSGNLCEVQPKALGSSMLNCLGNEFALHALQAMGLVCAKGALIVPVATGMALMLCMGSWRKSRPNAKFVIFLRVDQKSCFKSILTAGFEPLIIDPVRCEDALVTNVEKLNSLIEEFGEQILCVLSTVSPFAPRAPDDIETVAAICRTHNVFHLVNNAYGIQSKECIARLNNAKNSGRLDAFVQSLDKNFQIPVGGAIIATTKQSQASAIAQFYPGRASCVPSRDFVLTCLSLGLKGLRAMFEEQHRIFDKMSKQLRVFAEGIGETVYGVPDNQISLAMTLSTIPVEKQTLFGSVLFSRGITGARVVMSTTKISKIEGYEFMNFGSHTNEQHGGYLAMACGVGMTETELDEYFARLHRTYHQFLQKALHPTQKRDVQFDLESPDFDDTE